MRPFGPAVRCAHRTSPRQKRLLWALAIAMLSTVAQAEVTSTPAEESEKEPSLHQSDQSAESDRTTGRDMTQDRLKQIPEQQLKEAAKAAVDARSYKPWDEMKDSTFDWVRMTSGEWLKGQLKKLRDDDMTFDSDQFDMQTLSFSDVSDLHTPNRFIFILDDRSKIVGTADMADGMIVVQTVNGERSFPRSRVSTILGAKKREIQHWSFNLSLGATARRGNTQSVDYSAYSRLRREDAFHRLTATYNGAYGLLSTDRTTNKHRGDAAWNIYMTQVFYITPLMTTIQYDEFQNIALRTLVATGVGAHVLNKENISLDLELGTGYVRTGYLSTDADTQRSHNDDALMIPSLYIDWDITDDLEFEGSWTSAIMVTNIQNTFHHATARLSLELSEILDMDVSALYDRVESPVAREDGTIPYKDDLAITLGLGIELD